VPVVVRDIASGQERSLLEMALIENIQREDLNPIEEAIAYRRLADEFQLKQEDIASAVGKDRTSITNLLRVLALQPAVKQLVERGHITAGHARALLPIKDERRQLELANEIVARQLSVREVEARARTLTAEPSLPTPASVRTAPSSPTTTHADPATRRIEEQLRKHLQTDVHVQVLGGDRGVLRISFYSPDDLERLLDLMVGPVRSDFD